MLLSSSLLSSCRRGRLNLMSSVHTEAGPMSYGGRSITRRYVEGDWRSPPPPPKNAMTATPHVAALGVRRYYFPVDSHRTGEPGEAVVQYLQKRYGVSQYKSLSCLQVGTPQSPEFLLLEVSILNSDSMDVPYCVKISSYIRNYVECGYTFMLSQTCFLSLQCFIRSLLITYLYV